MPLYRISRGAFCIALLLALSQAAAASDLKPAGSTFGSRTDKPDGSSTLTLGRTLPTEWETKVGADVVIAAPVSPVPSDNILRAGSPDRSTGVIWGNIATGALRPLGFDRTAIEGRVDGGSDLGKIGATLSRSVPLSRDVSMTWQNTYSVTQPFGAPTSSPEIPVFAAPPAALTTPAQTRSIEEALRFNFAPSGTTLSAGATSSNADEQWRNKFSIEQTVAGPLKITTSIEDAGSPESRQSITAGFKKVW